MPGAAKPFLALVILVVLFPRKERGGGGVSKLLQSLFLDHFPGFLLMGEAAVMGASRLGGIPSLIRAPWKLAFFGSRCLYLLPLWRATRVKDS